MTRNLFFIALFFIVFAFTGCQSSHQVEVKPVEIKPIHITIDVNIRVEKALDDFFEDLEAAEDEIKE
ncbi:MAG: YnbE family lipoprotein [Deltaproteobacteria bacterium]|jgi:hypothetical protein|nr:YnbE family lipoprotein [Deltaproteobacteria bacterium]